MSLANRHEIKLIKYVPILDLLPCGGPSLNKNPDFSSLFVAQ